MKALQSPKRTLFRVLILSCMVLSLAGCSSLTPWKKKPTPQSTERPAPMATEASRGMNTPNDLFNLKKTHISGDAVGKEHHYRLSVTALDNVGNVIVEERLPASITFVRSEPAANQKSNRIYWTYPMMDRGETQNIEIYYIPTQEGEFDLHTVVAADPMLATSLFAGVPKLNIFMQGPSEVELGDEVVWSVRVENTGTATTPVVLVEDTLPKGLESTSSLSTSMNPIPSGNWQEMHVVAKPSTKGSFTNTASAQFENGEQYVSAQATVNVVQSRLSLSQRGPTETDMHTKSNFTLTVRNTGGTTLNNIRVWEEIPMFMHIHSIGEGGNPSHNTIYWNINSLKPGETQDLHFMATANKPAKASLKIDAEATSSTHKQLKETILYSMEWTAAPGLKTTLVDDSDPLNVGEYTVFTASISNTSKFKPVSNASVRIVFSPEMMPVATAGDMQGSIRGQEVHYPPINVEPGKEIKLKVRAQGMNAGVGSAVMQLKADFLPKVITSEEVTTVVD